MALKKVINSATQQFEPVLVDKLVLDAVPTVNSFNSVTSDAVARAVAGASGEVPAVTESDNGKVLKAIYDAGGPAVEWGEAAPAVTVDQTYNALSENPQSGTAVAEAVASAGSVSTSSGYNTINIDIGGDAPIRLEATRFGTKTVDYVTCNVKTVTQPNPTTLMVIFDLPNAQTFPFEAQIQLGSDITGDTALFAPDQKFAPAQNDAVVTAGPVATFNMTSSDNKSLQSGYYNVSIVSGPPYTYSQIGFTINGVQTSDAWTDMCNYIIANASTLFYASIPVTIKYAKLLPACTAADAGKVLQVQNDGTLAWVTLSYISYTTNS